MNQQAAVCVRDLGQMKLALRRDLILTPRIDGEQPGYVIEDRVQSKFYRVGLPEYTFLSLLDGRTTIRDALVIMARVEPEHAFDDGQAAAVVRWLLENELALSSESTARSASRTAPSGNTVEQRITRWNPICLRVPLLHPDRWLGRLLPWTDWLFITPALVAAVCLGLISLYQICLQWDRFAGASRGILAEGKWVWMLTGWLVVKALHELAHGLVCKRYGGTVREAGVVLILAAPVAYVDVTSSWRFRTKWERIHTALAGIHVELLIAAFSALLWSWLQPGVLSDLCYSLAVLCGATTLLFNVNPLMRFDGYYVLSDLTEIPNLASQGQQFLEHVLRRLCGISSTLPTTKWPRRLLIASYGLAALIWRGFVCCGLVLAAANLWQGAGLILAVAAVAIWSARPTIALVKYFLGSTPGDPPQRIRCLGRVAALCTVVVLAGAYLPWPLRCRAPALVDYAPPVIVRSESPGFVRQVHVQPGQQVAAGQIVLQLENEALQAEVEDLRLRVRESAARRRALNFQRDTPASQAEREEQLVLEHRLHQREQELSALAIRTPVAGTVVARDLKVLLGTYVTRGAELFAIGTEDQKELRVSVAQHDMEFFRRLRGENVWVRVSGGRGFWAPLTDICPRANQIPFHEALCAPLGGPLPVRELTPADAARKQRAAYELLAPRFEAHVALDADHSRTLLAGQRAVVSLPYHEQTIAIRLWDDLCHSFFLRSLSDRLAMTASPRSR